jgi:hypothetical protein
MYSSEYEFAEYMVKAMTERIAVIQARQAERLTPRTRRLQAYDLQSAQSTLERYTALRDAMRAENFDVVRETLKSDYKLVPLDPAKPCLRTDVTLLTQDWAAYRTESHSKAHGIRGWYSVDSCERVLKLEE